MLPRALPLRVLLPGDAGVHVGGRLRAAAAAAAREEQDVPALPGARGDGGEDDDD